LNGSAYATLLTAGAAIAMAVLTAAGLPAMVKY